MLSNKVRRSRSFFNLQSSLELSPKILSSIEFCHPRIDNESEECYSTENDSDELFQDTFPKEESEDILLNISIFTKIRIKLLITVKMTILHFHQGNQC